MAKSKLTLKLNIAWWFTYIYLPALYSALFVTRKFINIDAQPNKERVNYWLKKAFKAEVVK